MGPRTVSGWRSGSHDTPTCADCVCVTHSGELLDFSGQRLEITEVRGGGAAAAGTGGSQVTPGCSSVQKTDKVDFSWNRLADPKFVFHDHRLVETVREGNPEAQAFFRLLALCHTVMPEEKKEGQCPPKSWGT